MTEYKPQYVFAYATQYRSYYKDLIIDTSLWKKLDEKSKFEYAKIGNTNIILAPFFGQGAISYADVEDVCNFFKSRQPSIST